MITVLKHGLNNFMSHYPLSDVSLTKLICTTYNLVCFELDTRVVY
jgi:hypothetical protein